MLWLQNEHEPNHALQVMFLKDLPPCGRRIVISPKIPQDSPSCYDSLMRNLAVLPHERSTLRGADQPGSLQYRCHLLWRVMNKRPKLLARQPQLEVPKRKHGPHVPTVRRIGERQYLPGPRGLL
jgi:hypothetical protein